MSRRKNGIARGQIAIDKFTYACRNGSKSLHMSNLFTSGEVDGNAISEDGKTVLTVAILQRHLPAIRIILEHGAEVNRPSHVYYHRDHISPNIWSYNESPLVTAARLNYTPMVQVLLEFGARMNFQNECRPPQGLETLKDRTALHFAAERGNAEMVELLLENGAEVNIPDKQGELPIHLAVRCRSATCKSQRSIIEMLERCGSEVNASNKIGCVPLYLAAFYGCVSKAAMLVRYGADVNHRCTRDNSYVTSLHIAATKDRFQLAKLLIENCANLNLTNTLGYTPLQLNINALSRSDIACLLVHHGADLTVIDRFRLTLMAALIRNLRIDCEQLAQVLVAAGYNLNRDLWLVPERLRTQWLGSPMEISPHDSEDEIYAVSEPPDVPIPQGRVERLCDWLRERQRNPRCLTEACRVAIRQYLSRKVTLGCSVLACILELPLPAAIKRYLLLTDVHDMSEVS